MHRLALAALLLAPLATAQEGALAPVFKITIFDPVDGMDTNSPRSINAAGEIAGVAQPEPFHPVSLPLRVALDGTVTTLPASDVAYNYGFGLNGKGLVAGMSNTLAVVWDAGQLLPLAPTPGFSSGSAQDVNERGLIVGSSGDFDFAGPHPVVWRGPTSAAINLPGLTGTMPPGTANAVNDRGQVAGTVGSVGIFHAVRWDAPTGPPLQIGPLPGKDNSDGLGMSQRGDVVGRSSSTTDFTTEAFLHVAATGQLVPLGHLPTASFQYSEAWGVNVQRQVVGAANAGDVSHGFLWQDGVLHDLNDLLAAPLPAGQYIQSAVDINDAGQIAVEVSVGPYPQTRIGRLTLAGVGG